VEQITLEPRNLANIRACGTPHHYQPGEIIFSEGDPADRVYFIESGTISIFLHEFTNRVEIGQRGPWSFIGEMAAITRGKRTASACALADSTLVILDQQQFLKLMEIDEKINDMINRLVAQRTEELALKENLLSTTGIKGNHLQISIKGDPSMRETVFDRERRESPMDKVLADLLPQLQALLLKRCVTEVSLHFNSGEIRLTSIFDPFNYGIHPANKLIDNNYLDRHFPLLAFADKVALIRRLYDTLASQFENVALPKYFKDNYLNRYRLWEPLSEKEIARIIDKLLMLRTIPNYYLRNIGISITRDAVRMQFNCDGTHIVSTGDYNSFLEENLGVECAT